MMFEVLQMNFKPYIQCEMELKEREKQIKGKKVFAIGGGGGGGGGYSSCFKIT